MLCLYPKNMFAVCIHNAHVCCVYTHHMIIWSYHEKIRSSTPPHFCTSAFLHFAFPHVASSAFRISETSAPKPPCRNHYAETSAPKPLRRNLHAETSTPRPLRRNLHAETSTPKLLRRNFCAAGISDVGIYFHGHMYVCRSYVRTYARTYVCTYVRTYVWPRE